MFWNTACVYMALFFFDKHLGSLGLSSQVPQTEGLETTESHSRPHSLEPEVRGEGAYRLVPWGHAGDPVPVPSFWQCLVISGAPGLMDTSPSLPPCWHGISLCVCAQVSPSNKD